MTRQRHAGTTLSRGARTELQNCLGKRLRRLLRWIVADIFQHAPLIVRGKMFLMRFRQLAGNDAIIGAVKDDGRNVNPGLSGQSRFD